MPTSAGVREIRIAVATGGELLDHGNLACQSRASELLPTGAAWVAATAFSICPLWCDLELLSLMERKIKI